MFRRVVGESVVKVSRTRDLPLTSQHKPLSEVSPSTLAKVSQLVTSPEILSSQLTSPLPLAVKHFEYQVHYTTPFTSTNNRFGMPRVGKSLSARAFPGRTFTARQGTPIDISISRKFHGIPRFTHRTPREFSFSFSLDKENVSPSARELSDVKASNPSGLSVDRGLREDLVLQTGLPCIDYGKTSLAQPFIFPTGSSSLDSFSYASASTKGKPSLVLEESLRHTSLFAKDPVFLVLPGLNPLPLGVLSSPLRGSRSYFGFAESEAHHQLDYNISDLHEVEDGSAFKQSSHPSKFEGTYTEFPSKSEIVDLPDLEDVETPQQKEDNFECDLDYRTLLSELRDQRNGSRPEEIQGLFNYIREAQRLRYAHQKGLTVLMHIAVSMGKKDLEFMRYLVKHFKDDVNLINIYGENKGRAAIHFAVRAGNLAFLNLILLVKSLKINLIDEDGKTALDHAKELGREDIVKLLQAHNALSRKEMTLHDRIYNKYVVSKIKEYRRSQHVDSISAQEVNAFLKSQDIVVPIKHIIRFLAEKGWLKLVSTVEEVD